MATSLSTGVAGQRAGEFVVYIRGSELFVKRGSTVTVNAEVFGPSVKVVLEVSSNEPGIHTTVNPRYGVVPLSTTVTIRVASTARLGAHVVMLVALDAVKGEFLAGGRIVIHVVDDELLGIAKRIEKYRELYKRFGAQCAVLKAVWDLKEKLTYAQLRAIYEMITGRPLSRGTVHELVSRLTRKGLLVREKEGYVFNQMLTFLDALNVVDFKRAQNGLKGAAKMKSSSKEGKAPHKVPAEVMKLLKVASEIAVYDYWKAIDLIAHTVIGVRETGRWILWVNDYFVYYEKKTGLYHYFRSRMLSEMLKELGLEEGVMIKHTKHPARDLIRELYGSYANARRLHYLLKERGLFEYSGFLLLEGYYNEFNKPLYLTLKDMNDVELWSYGEKPENAHEVKKVIVLPGEHVDSENEETYFYRPAGTL